ncbi:MAG: n-acetylglutamate synthase [Pyrinomonadaceae bacterium]|nr:n-acetylglutamate synthase [Pyrinomonadaceae bacterium]
MLLNYNNRIFRSVSNSRTGEVSVETVFRYSQKGTLVRGVYSGGEIVYGTLIARCDENGRLDMRYQHLNKEGELKTGVCVSTPEILDDGRVRLHERWRWTCDERDSGESVIEEIDTQA